MKSLDVINLCKRKYTLDKNILITQ